MIIRRTEKIYHQKDKGIFMRGGSQIREYRKRTYWFLFIPVYTVYAIISKVK
jgi:hypothetical protein